ncbi:hypothetical protein QFC21_005236 [Naganishia friedmannii]|uniref:Uncharacterized protein n=1 Tax=Naganishia friedmannii TaxID=89922 RepID=A0ACC2VAN1_9TREE|nr:hypothetical protein QFC21_005236 [Naganishia friedmannii]
MSLRHLLLLASCLCSPAIAKVFTEQNGTITYLNHNDDVELASAATASAYASITTTSVPSAYTSFTSVASVSSTASATTYTSLGATISTKPYSIPVSVSTSSSSALPMAHIVGKTSEVPVDTVHLAQPNNETKPPFVGKRRLQSTRRVVADAFDDIHHIKHLKTNQSAFYDTYNQGPHDGAVSSDGYILSDFSDTDEMRLRILLSSQADRIFSFASRPFYGYVVDAGIARLPKNWDQRTDPPQLHDIAKQWRTKISVLDRQIEMNRSNRREEEKRSTRFRQEEMEKVRILDRKTKELDETIRESYADISARELLADIMYDKLHKSTAAHMNEVFNFKYKVATTDINSKAVAIYFPPMYPPLRFSPFHQLLQTMKDLFKASTWRRGSKWLVAQVTQKERHTWLEADVITATDVIVNTLITIPPGKLEKKLELMRASTLVSGAPDQAREVLDAHPHLAYALSQAMLLLNVTEPAVISRVQPVAPFQPTATIYRPGPTVTVLPTSPAEPKDWTWDDVYFGYEDGKHVSLEDLRDLALPPWSQDDRSFGKNYRCSCRDRSLDEKRMLIEEGSPFDELVPCMMNALPDSAKPGLVDDLIRVALYHARWTPYLILLACALNLCLIASYLGGYFGGLLYTLLHPRSVHTPDDEAADIDDLLDEEYDPSDSEDDEQHAHEDQHQHLSVTVIGIRTAWLIIIFDGNT